ncbi:helix-turn-helix domain-containing protein [Amycolatopsis sp. NPDC051102]|uniref:helix-turn-helix domain-containing protein n=1 Tax=Amycolatopsis sp. NPDC051102 TaxID=3155163 RepID=UPI00341272BD
MTQTRAQHEQRDTQIVEAYTGGDNEHQVAERFGLTVAAIEKILDDRQVGVRGGRNYRVHRKTYEAGSTSIRALAREVGVGYATMHTGLAHAGTNFRGHGGSRAVPAAAQPTHREDPGTRDRAEPPRRSTRTPDTTPPSAPRIQPASPSPRDRDGHR